jgi:hypothetical protein
MTRREEIREKWDDYSMAQLAAIVLWKTGELSLERAATMCHSSPEVLSRSADELKPLAAKMLEEEDELAAIWSGPSET